jgi:single-strand DNA-binding protein
MNIVHILGRVGKDPEIKSFPSGDSLAQLTIATTEKWKDKNTGEKKEKTQWHNVVVRGSGLIKVVESYVKRGDLLRISGSLEYRQWEKDGVKRTSAEIVVGMKGDLQLLSNRGGENYGSQAYAKEQSQPAQRKSFAEDLEDEIPFNSV